MWHEGSPNRSQEVAGSLTCKKIAAKLAEAPSRKMQHWSIELCQQRRIAFHHAPTPMVLKAVNSVDVSSLSSLSPLSSSSSLRVANRLRILTPDDFVASDCEGFETEGFRGTSKACAHSSTSHSILEPLYVLYFASTQCSLMCYSLLLTLCSSCMFLQTWHCVRSWS